MNSERTDLSKSHLSLVRELTRADRRWELGRSEHHSSPMASAASRSLFVSLGRSGPSPTTHL